MSALSDSENEARIKAWIERNMNGRVVTIERQGRWRPAWFVEAATPEGPRSLYVRGRRDQAELLFFPLSHEAKVLRVLHAAGLPAPKVYGLCDDPEAIIMDRMPGRADLSTAQNSEEARVVLLEMMELLARMHALAPESFSDAGLTVPQSAEALHFTMFDLYERIQLENQRWPEPEIAFVKRWLRNNLPSWRTRASFVTCDSGQFLFDKGRITSLIDLECAHIGDTALDLASLLMRDMSEPLGDLAPAFARYEEITGEPIDWRAVRYYLVLWGIMVPMVTKHLTRDPTPELSFMYNLEQALVLTRRPLEELAALTGVTLEPVPPRLIVSGEGATQAQNAALKAAAGALNDLKADDPFRRYRWESALDLHVYFSVLTEQEPRILCEERAEVRELLGRDIADERERDAALEAFVLTAGADKHATLVHLLHRRISRREALLGPEQRLFARKDIQSIPEARM